MPVETGSDTKGCFARWGKSGAKYHYPCGNETLRNEAKQKAYIQGLAIGEYAETLRIGDAVSWKTQDQNPRGKIREIIKSPKTVPGTDFVLEGTPEDPGYIIEIYEQMEGKWKPTGRFVGRKRGSILKNISLYSPVKKS